jgi:hypothetical protein
MDNETHKWYCQNLVPASEASVNCEHYLVHYIQITLQIFCRCLKF